MTDTGARFDCKYNILFRGNVDAEIWLETPTIPYLGFGTVGVPKPGLRAGVFRPHYAGDLDGDWYGALLLVDSSFQPLNHIVMDLRTV